MDQTRAARSTRNRAPQRAKTRSHTGARARISLRREDATGREHR